MPVPRFWVALLSSLVGTLFALAISAAASSPLALCIAPDISGSNWQPSDGYAASDPGPEYVRAGLLHLIAELLAADTGGRRVLIGFVPLGTEAMRDGGLVDVSADQTRQELERRFAGALQPGGWTSFDRALQACGQQLQQAPAGSAKYVILLSDGRPERPDA